jgi:hypothetical protein
MRDINLENGKTKMGKTSVMNKISKRETAFT